MSELPWFQFYPNDWLAGTRGLSAVETGVYITIIATLYDRAAPLPNNPERLARMCGASKRVFVAALERLVDDGKLMMDARGIWNARVEQELQSRNEKVERNKKAAESRWEWKTEQNQRESDADALQPQCQNDAISEVRSQKSDIEERPLSETSSDESKPDGKRKRVAYPEQFEEFWKSYPTDPNMAKVEAFKAWQKLDADDRGRAIATLPAFKTWVKQQRDYRTLHAFRYLSQRRFDGFAGAEQQAGTAALPVKIVLEGTPEWESLKSKNPRLTARDIRTDGGVVRGTYDYGSRAA